MLPAGSTITPARPEVCQDKLLCPLHPPALEFAKTNSFAPCTRPALEFAKTSSSPIAPTRPEICQDRFLFPRPAGFHVQAWNNAFGEHLNSRDGRHRSRQFDHPFV